MNIRHYFQFRLLSFLIFVLVSAVFAALLFAPSHPPEVTRILQSLSDIPPDADLETVARVLLEPDRKADGSDRLRPDTHPRLYVDIVEGYRLAIDITCEVTHRNDGTVLYGPSCFEGARVQVRQENNGSWNDVFPIRTKYKMQDKLWQK